MLQKIIRFTGTVLLSMVTVLSTQIANSACIWWLCQPEEPVELKKK